jgi:hypothetical protein
MWIDRVRQRIEFCDAAERHPLQRLIGWLNIFKLSLCKKFPANKDTVA